MDPVKDVKIYLPVETNQKNQEDLYFYGKIIEDSKSYKFFVVKYSKQFHKTSCIGRLVNNANGLQSGSSLDLESNFIQIYQNQQSEITKIHVQVHGKTVESSSYLLIRFKLEKFHQLSRNELETDKSLTENDFFFLANLIESEYEPTKFTQIFSKIKLLFYTSFICLCNIFSAVLRPFSIIFNNTAICRHFMDWKKKLQDGDQECSILFDVLMGIAVFVVLSYVQLSGKYFMNLTEQIVYRLRDLLEMLKGSPAGLKLNVQLNNFLLDCFMYHVDLWWNFIMIVKPTIQYLFIPLTIMGLFGLSFQCAMLCDLLVLITLHAHCFYIYAALLYKIELSGLQSLFRIVLGRRKNVLRVRVEAQEYTNRQLYVATLFFTMQLFLLPTVIVYYVVFALLRFLIYCPTYFLMMVQRAILMFPFNTYLRWLMGSYVNLGNVEMKFISCRVLNNSNLVSLYIEPNASKPWKKDLFERKNISRIQAPISLTKFIACLVKGKLMAFSKLNNGQDQGE